MTREEVIKKELNDIMKMKGVLSSAVISKEGFVISGFFQHGVDQEIVAAMIATLAGAGEQVLIELVGGDLILSSVEGQKKNMVVVDAGNAFVVCVTDKGASIKELVPKIVSTGKKIKKILTK